MEHEFRYRRLGRQWASPPTKDRTPLLAVVLFVVGGVLTVALMFTPFPSNTLGLTLIAVGLVLKLKDL